MNRVLGLFRSMSEEDLGLKAEPEEVALPRGAAPPLMSQIISDMGFGRAQLQVMLTGGALWGADAAELMIISAASEAVQQDFGLTPLERSSFISIIFAGVLLGNFIGGMFGDACGRRAPILNSYAGIFVFSIMSACTWSYLSLAVMRFFVGLSIGMGQPAETTLIAEVTPRMCRVVAMSITFAMFPFGEMIGALLIWYDDPLMRELHWRHLVAVSAVPGLVFGVATYLFNYESPYYLARNGDHQAAVRVLEKMRAANRIQPKDLDVEFRMPETVVANAWTQLATIFSLELLPITVVMCLSTFLINTVLYGSLYGFAIILPQTTSAPAAQQFIGALWELPGYCVGALLGSFAPRRTSTYIYFFFTSLSFVGVAIADVGTFAFHISFYGVRIWPCLGYTMLYLLSAEVYPTEARVSGVAVSLSFGHVGGIAAAPLFEVMLQHFGSFRPFMWFIAFLLLVNWILFACMPILPASDVDVQGLADSETKDKMQKGYGSISEREATTS